VNTQQIVIEWFNVVQNEGRAIVTLKNIKQKKHELI
jgi:hypothetical protein